MSDDVRERVAQALYANYRMVYAEMSGAVPPSPAEIAELWEAEIHYKDQFYRQANVLAEAGLLAPAPLREVTVEQVEAAAKFAYKTDWAAQRTARMPFSDKYTGDQYRGRARAMFRAAGFVVQDAVDRAEGDGSAAASEPTVPASQLRAFARQCVDGGDMTPAAARMLDRIIDGDGRAEK